MRSLVVAFAVLAPSIAFACGMRMEKMIAVKAVSLDDVFAEIDGAQAVQEVAPPTVAPAAPAAPVAAPVAAPAQPAS